MQKYLVANFVTQELLLALVKKCDASRVSFQVEFGPSLTTFYCTTTDSFFQELREVVYDYDNHEQIARERQYKGD